MQGAGQMCAGGWSDVCRGLVLCVQEAGLMCTSTRKGDGLLCASLCKGAGLMCAGALKGGGGGGGGGVKSS